MTDELERLGKLHKDGVLSDDEFAKAKNKLLNQGERDDSDANRTEDNSLGQAANRYVTLQAVMAVIGVIIFFNFSFWSHFAAYAAQQRPELSVCAEMSFVWRPWPASSR